MIIILIYIFVHCKKIEVYVKSGFCSLSPIKMPMELWIFNQWMDDNGFSLYDDLNKGKTKIPEAIMNVSDFRLYIVLQMGYEMILGILAKDDDLDNN